jgi:hypothetical protein
VEKLFWPPLALSSHVWHTGRVKRWLTIGIVVLVLVLAALMAWRIAKPQTSPQVPLPNPNGYDDFVRAAQLYVPWSDDLSKMSPEQLRTIVQQNSAALEEVRRGLNKESAVLVTNEINWLNSHLPRLSANKAFAQLLTAQGLLSLEEKRTNDAARSFSECIKFGYAAHHRGLMLDDMVASACQALGAGKLESIRAGISKSTLEQVIQTLVAADANRESAATILQRDRAWARGTEGGLKTMLANMFARSQMRSAETKFINQHNSSVTRLRFTIIKLGLSGYRAEHGKLPAKLDDLVPEWLPAIPLDPKSKLPLAYRVDDDGFSLSTGAPKEREQSN